MQKEGAKGESNPRPLAPKARIIPLDHWPFADEQKVRRPGIEPGPPAWKAGILTTELTTLLAYQKVENPGFDPGASSLLTTHSTD